MNPYDCFISELKSSYETSFKSLKTECLDSVLEECQRFERITNQILKAKTFSDISKKTRDEINSLVSENPIKENETPNTKSETSKTSIKSKRKAFREASSIINQQLGSPLHHEIKKEKISITSEDTNVTKTEMLAPTQLPPRLKKVKQESAGKTNLSERNLIMKGVNSLEMPSEERNSDVLIADSTITIVQLSDSDDDEKTKYPILKNSKKNETEECTSTRSTRSKAKKVKPVEENTRSTRTKSKIKPKRNRSNTGESEESAVPKRSKSDPKSEVEHSKFNGTTNTEYEDALSVLGDVREADGTFTVVRKSNRKKDKDCVVVISEKDNLDINKELRETHNSIMTEDESHEEVKSPIKQDSKSAKILQVFNPYEHSPVKKKIEAYEKLRGLGVTTTAKVKMTKDTPTTEPRGKTRLLHTPLTKSCSSTKISKFIGLGTPTFNESKTSSAIKASHSSFRDREMKRREKEIAIKKREALSQAHIEEKKKRNEEKLLRAQKQREVIEKEKQKVVEMSRLKEERYKQKLIAHEEQLRKRKEESEKRRKLAKMKALEEKQKNIAIDPGNMGNGKQQINGDVNFNEPKRPIYMMTNAPLLPTDDCYDSDEPDYATCKPVRPAWASGQQQKLSNYYQVTVGEKLKNTLFLCKAQTPNLSEIFVNIAPQKLQRSSSAIWRKPPRYTTYFEDLQE